MDEDTSWQRQLLVGAVVLLAVAILVGGIIAVIALKAADVAGITEAGETSGPATIQTTPDASQSTEPSEPTEPPTTGPATTEETTSEPATSTPATSGPEAAAGTTTSTTTAAPTVPDFTTTAPTVPDFTTPDFTTPDPTTTAPRTKEPTTTQSAEPPESGPVTAIQLSASPQSAGTYDRVNLTGSYPAAEGVTLQVQRYEFGAWVDFPTTASISDGTFSTYVQTGRSGLNRFRMLDTSTGRTSNVVTVSIS